MYIILELVFSEEDTLNWAKFGWWKYTWCHFKLWVCEVRDCFNFGEYDQPAWMFRSWATKAYKIKSPKKEKIPKLRCTLCWSWCQYQSIWRNGDDDEGKGEGRLHLQRNSCSSSLGASGVPRVPSECTQLCKVRLSFIYCFFVPICICICLYAYMCPYKLHIHDEKHQQNRPTQCNAMQCNGDLWKKQNWRKSLFVRSAEVNNKIAEDFKLEEKYGNFFEIV